MRAALLILVVLCLPLGGVAAGPREDVVVADFEGATYGDWTTTGTAFGDGPARGTLRGQMRVDGYRGDGLVNSFSGGDKSVGTLTSPPFTIERPYLAFLIGGGKDAEKLALRLIVDGRPARVATGPNDRPGGSETLGPASWDVSDLVGKAATLEIVDRATGGWGHINVDQIVQTDRRPPRILRDLARTFVLENRYLQIPITHGAPVRRLTLAVDGQPDSVNRVELAPGTPDYWTFLDLAEHRGKTVTLRVDELPEDSTALAAIEPSDTLRDAESIYREPLRGQFHFSSKRGWLNDPNGLAYYDGEYHLFYQHNPYGWPGLNKHWGHAVSTDLVHWTELAGALPNDPMGQMYSGSAVVDHANTSGFGRDGKAPLVLIYTAAGNPTTQCLAYSTDGRTFTKYAGNPVLGQITPGNRDPKVIWHEPTGRWVMVLYVGRPGPEGETDAGGRPSTRHTIEFFTSPDLKAWTRASVLAVDPPEDRWLYECPDFFPLAVDGDPAKTKWVLAAARSGYYVGTFDGTTFTPEGPAREGHHGQGVYAPQTFSDVPAADGRRIRIGWFQTTTPGMPFNQSMTVPYELRLVSTPDGPRMTSTPVEELETLRGEAHHAGPVTITPGGADPLDGIAAELIELRADFAPSPGAVVTFAVRGQTIVYDAKAETLTVNGRQGPAPLRDGRQRIAVYCDRTGVEVFASDGLTYMPTAVNVPANDRSVGVRVEAGEAAFSTLDVYELKSAWPTP